MTHGFAEDIEDSASGSAVSCLFEVRDDGCLCANGYRDFEGHLVASVNQGLFHGVGVTAGDLIRHVPNFSGHGCKIHIRKDDACSVRVPGDDFSVFIEPVSVPLAGGAAVECAVGFHAIETGLVFNFTLVNA